MLVLRMCCCRWKEGASLAKEKRGDRGWLRVAPCRPEPGAGYGQMPSRGLPSRTNGNATTRTGTSRPRMSTRTSASSAASPAGTRAKAIALPSVGENVPDRRSEEHTSELQSLMRISYAVFCLKKKKHTNHHAPVN